MRSYIVVYTPWMRRSKAVCAELFSIPPSRSNRLTLMNLNISQNNLRLKTEEIRMENIMYPNCRDMRILVWFMEHFCMSLNINKLE